MRASFALIPTAPMGVPAYGAGKNADARTNLQKYLELDPNGKDASTAKEMLNYVK